MKKVIVVIEVKVRDRVRGWGDLEEVFVFDSESEKLDRAVEAVEAVLGVGVGVMSQCCLSANWCGVKETS